MSLVSRVLCETTGGPLHEFSSEREAFRFVGGTQFCTVARPFRKRNVAASAARDGARRTEIEGSRHGARGTRVRADRRCSSRSDDRRRLARTEDARTNTRYTAPRRSETRAACVRFPGRGVRCRGTVTAHGRTPRRAVTGNH